MVVKTPEMTTAKQFFTKFLGIIQGMSASYDELRIVFDQYISGTLKETTRKKRSLKLAHIHYHVNDDTEIKSIKSFLAHIDTKAGLTTYLSHNIISHYQGHRQKVLVMHHTTMLSNCPLSDIVSMPGMSSGRHSLEEENQLVLLNACDVMHKDPQSFLDVFSVDTDVFVLTGHYKLIPKSTTLIRRGSERLSIRERYLQLGQKRADALIGWYEFKGTDNTGSFAGKGVSCQFKAFLQADDDILDAFSRFGAVPEIPRIIHQQMERHTCLLYKLGDTCAEEVPELRWMLFAQKSKEGQQLPPTLGSLVPHTARAYHIALIWKTSKEPFPQFPPPTDYFWVLVDGRLKPVYCTNLPAPSLSSNFESVAAKLAAPKILGSASECVLVTFLAAKTSKVKELEEQGLIEHDGNILHKLTAYCSKEVCATLGSTSSCSFDRLDELGPVCESLDVWLHVDAAYAGGFFICPENKYLLKGIEYASSFNMNPNKSLLINHDCSAMWVKKRYKLIQTFIVDPLYLQHKDSGLIGLTTPCMYANGWSLVNVSEHSDTVNWGIALTRRFRSLKIWFVIRNYGIQGLQKHVRKQMRLAKLFEDLVKNDDRFEITNKVILGLVCFRIKGSDNLNERLLSSINSSAKIHMVPASMKNRFVIRFCVCSENIKDTDIVHAWSVITECASTI
ncbi:Tyrosine decarboxylase [Nymphon striatum]|nr:Tyrosine decarboxylase [Nymphon striatum]